MERLILRIIKWNLTIVSFISMLAIANRNPVGSRPMAKQNRITCMTGNAKMNSITPTFRHIRKKFFCNKARIFPLDVNYFKKTKKMTFHRLKSCTLLVGSENAMWLLLHCNIQRDQLLISHRIRFHHFDIQVVHHSAENDSVSKMRIVFIFLNYSVIFVNRKGKKTLFFSKFK